MRFRVRVSGVLVAATLLLEARVALGQEALVDANSNDLDALSFFDYLGAMVDDDGEWLDPLELAEQPPLGDLDETVDAAVTQKIEAKKKIDEETL